MASLFKWLFGIVFLLIVLIVGAVIILPMVVDPNDYKGEIVTAVKEQTGRDIAIEQKLNLSVFPWLGIETGGVTLSNAQGFTAKSFAEVDDLGIRVKLMPLLSQQVEVDTLVIKGLRLNLEKDKTGKTNWDDLAGDKEDKEEDKTDDEDGKESVALKVQGIQIEGARISWDDRQKGEKYVIDGVRLVTGSLAPGATVPVEAGLKVVSSKPAMTLDLDLKADVATNAALTRYDISNLLLELAGKGEGLPEQGVELKLRGDISADTEADTLKISGLDLQGPNVALNGDIAVTRMQTSPGVSGQIRLQETNLKTLAAMFASPIETTDEKALTRVSGDFTLKQGGDAIHLKPLSLKLDDSTLSGYVSVLNTKGPVIRSELTLDEIDIDRYLPPAKQGEAAAKPEKKAAKADPSEDQFAALRPLDLQANLKIGKLKVSNARMADVTVKIVSKGGLLRINPMSANLYEGKFAGDIKLDARKKTPKVHAIKHLTGIQIGPLLKDVAGQDRLLGKGEVHVDVRIAGLSEAQVRRTLNGKANFKFLDGAYKGVDLSKLISLGGSSGNDSEARTDFSEMSASLKMKNGVITNKDLQAKSPLLRVNGKGKVDLPKDKIDYLLTTTLVGSLQGQGGKGLKDLSGIPIPVRISGSLADPSYRPDLEAALSAKAKQQIEVKKEELKEKATEKLKEKLGGKLKGLFGR